MSSWPRNARLARPAILLGT